MMTDELVGRFLRGECSSEEAKLVEQYFRDHPGEMGRLMDEKEWMEAGGEGELEDGLSVVMLDEIRRQAYGSLNGQQQEDLEEGYLVGRSQEDLEERYLVGRQQENLEESYPVGRSQQRQQRIAARRLMLVRWTVAASIILIAGLIWLIVRTNRSTPGTDPVAKESGQARVRPGNDDEASWTIQKNPSSRETKIGLPDGSQLTLAANSTVKYQEPFTKREIYLDGEAFFNITKDEARPFRVYSGSLSTTVLGTSFRVTAFHNGKICIRLFTGKVLVGAAGQRPAGWQNDITLSPGEQLQYDTTDRKVALSHFSEGGRNDDGRAGRTGGAKTDESDWVLTAAGDLVFNNAPFHVVIDKLEKKYNITIQYSRSETSDIYFSGTVSSTDSLQVVLQLIARMDNLDIHQQQGVYIVRRARN